MPRWAEKNLTGWGRVFRATTLTARPERTSDLEGIFLDTDNQSLLAHGAGRSYGDAALNSAGRSVLMTRLDRFLAFDPQNGTLVAEAGATFADTIATFLPRGFLPPVVPGTGFATLGGGIANDVHGKNHHQAGSFGQHLEWFDLRLPSGEIRRVLPDSPLFKATVGGVGLTGIVQALCLRLRRVPSNAVVVCKRRIPDLDHFLAAFEEEQERSEYVVGWIDATARGKSSGRGILEVASPATESLGSESRRPARVPFDFPGFALNPVSVRLFNEVYFRTVSWHGTEQRMEYQKFLFPLDAIHDWNRIYGRRGFRQFQCVIPFSEGRVALQKLLEMITRSGRGSFLAVLKAMGRPGAGFLSFPLPGYTLALDFPNVPGTTDLLAGLERITCDYGGRIYLAKDSTMSAESFRGMYPDLEKFAALLREVDPQGRMGSDLSRRLNIGRNTT